MAPVALARPSQTSARDSHGGTLLARGSSVSKSCRSPVIDTIAMSPGWRVHSPPPHGTKLPHLRMKITPLSNRLVWLQASLPHLLYGHNRRVIASQGELNTAFESLLTHLQAIAEVPPLADWPTPARVDLPWQLDAARQCGAPVASILLAHAGLSVPEIQEPAVRRRNSVSWKGCKREIFLYGKSRKHRIGDSVLRAEVRLHRSEVARWLPNGQWRDFLRLWHVFREIMLKVPIIQAPRPGGGFPEAIGRSVPPEYHEKILAELSHKKPRTVRDYRRRMNIAAARLPDRFSWAEYLPANSPPPAVAVEASGASGLCQELIIRESE